jgi:hypothetical protein
VKISDLTYVKMSVKEEVRGEWEEGREKEKIGKDESRVKGGDVKGKDCKTSSYSFHARACRR